ncbi:hypothetical protein FRX31_008717, partial [Thalictrum thalictroides]
MDKFVIRLPRTSTPINLVPSVSNVPEEPAPIEPNVVEEPALEPNVPMETTVTNAKRCHPISVEE